MGHFVHKNIHFLGASSPGVLAHTHLGILLGKKIVPLSAGSPPPRATSTKQSLVPAQSGQLFETPVGSDFALVGIFDI